jgi:hypothetical protein
MKTLLTALALCFVVTAYSQHTPHSLKEEKVLTELKQKTNYFDSLIVIDKSSSWKDNPKINGFGFKGTSVYRIEIALKESDSAELLVKKLVKKKVSRPATVRQLLESRYSFIKNLNDDSLNLRPPRLHIADPEIWSILLVNHKNNSSLLRQSFAPRSFQRTIPTRQRRTFIEFVEALEEQLK